MSALTPLTRIFYRFCIDIIKIETRPVFPAKTPLLPPLQQQQQQQQQAQRVRFSDVPASKGSTVSHFGTAEPATPAAALAPSTQPATPITPAPVMAPLSPAATPVAPAADGGCCDMSLLFFFSLC